MTTTYLHRGSTAPRRERISEFSAVSAVLFLAAFRKARDAAERHTPFGVLGKTEREAVVRCAARDTGCTEDVAREMIALAGPIGWAA
jgi:hypothetical protein